MALVLADRVKESTTTTGTGTVTLLGAATGFQSFAVIGNANTTYYTIAGQTTSEWEVGIGTYTLAGTLLARTTVLSNSSGTQPSALSFSAGTKDVFVTYPSSKSVNLDASGNATALGTPASGVVTNLTGTASININGTVGATTPAAAAFTTLGATGVATFSAGTALLPAITTTGDTNTGIWFPAADTIAFTEGGVESMRIDSSGNLGLGVTPSAQNIGSSFELKGGASLSGGTFPSMYLTSNAVYNSSWTYKQNGFASFYLQQSGQHQWQIAPSGTAGNAITFTQAMTLDASGNLGIGTASPTFGVDVQNTGALTAALSATRFSTAGASSYLYLSASRSATVGTNTALQSGDTMGIVRFSGADGTTYKSSVDIRGFVDGAVSTGVVPGGLSFFTNSNGTLNERMRLDSSGNVGIGTSSPAYKLDVNGEASISNGTNQVLLSGVSGNIEIVRSDATPFVDFKSTIAEDYDCRIQQQSNGLAFQTGGNGSASERMRIDSSGNVGIGTTTPVAQLGVYGAGQTTAAMSTSSSLGGTVYLRDSGSGAGNGGVVMFGANQGAFAAIKGLLTDGSNNTLGAIAFSTRDVSTDAALTERMRIDQAGRVGIGGTPTTGVNFFIAKAVTGGATSFSTRQVVTVQSDVTTTAIIFDSVPSTQAASFTLGSLQHYRATQSTIGASSSITTQVGFIAESTLTGATTNVGFYGNIASGTGRYNFYANGTADNYFAGNVGIGTSSPVTKLNIVDALSGGQLLVATNQTNTTEKYGTFGTQHYTNAEEPALGLAVQSNATDNIILVGGALGEFNAATQVRFYTAANNTTVTGTERMRIDSSGNVGIGTSSPATGRKLHVIGTIGSYNSANDNQTLMTNNGTVGSINVTYGTTGSYLPLTFLTSDTERMRIDSSGNVGIGGTPVNGMLELFKTSGEAVLRINNTAASAWLTLNGATAGYIHNITNTPTIFTTNGSERMRIDSSGNVGIGTSSPSLRLHVSGSSTYVAGVEGSSTFALMGFKASGTTGTMADPNVAIGATGDALSFRAGGAERARIDSSGNVLVINAAGLGYGTGAGGTVTQATNKGTAVTLNKPTGQVTTNNAALGSGSTVSFSINNSIITATDVVVVVVSAGSSYTVQPAFVSGGVFNIRLTNTTGGSLSEAVVINFAVIKGATS